MKMTMEKFNQLWLQTEAKLEYRRARHSVEFGLLKDVAINYQLSAAKLSAAERATRGVE